MTKRRFSRDDWVALGLAELSARGPEGVKLEAICTAAGLTRGSFYHHFKGHEGFLAALAQRWRDAQTTELAEALDTTAPPADQSAALTDAALEIDYRLELGIRELGRRVPAIAVIIREADAARLAVLSALYRQRYGLDASSSDDLAYIEYATFSGVILLDPEMPEARQRALAGLFDTMIGKALRQ
ncbi:MAG: TetR/AcrR family transcriptional regulator [Pseudomonadota bacterium]